MKKNSKSKSPQPTLGVDQDIVGLITTLVAKLVSLEAKIDTVLKRLPERAVEPSRQQPAPASNAAVQRHNGNVARPMYKVICADCGSHCEVPFKPATGRPVYCKECFAKRKTHGNFAPKVEMKAPAALPAQQSLPEKSQAAKPVPAPRPKKKPPAKKAKKKTAK